MNKIDIFLLVLIGILIGSFFVVAIIELKYGMSIKEMKEEFTDILNEIECEELYTYSYSNDSEFVKNFVVNECLFGEEAKELERRNSI